MKKAKKHPGGRPTLYRGAETVKALVAWTKGMTAINFNQRCTKAHIADRLFDVAEDTVYAWVKEHPEFSEAIKRWETKRDSLLFEVRGLSDTRWIFYSKNMLGWRDKQEVSGPGGGPVSVAFIMPRPEAKK